METLTGFGDKYRIKSLGNGKSCFINPHKLRNKYGKRIRMSKKTRRKLNAAFRAKNKKVNK